MKVKVKMKMRSNKIVYFLVLVFLALPRGCEQWLEVEPDQGLIINEYWQSREDVEATMMAAYRNFALLDEKLFLFGELRADMMRAGNNVQPSDDRIMNNNITPENALCEWGDFYKVIHHCNLVLEHSEEVQAIDPNFTQVTLKTFQAEALFLRSLAYFYLVRIFKEVPLVLYSSETDNVEFFINKSESNVILDTLEQNLIAARSFMPNNQDFGTAAANKGRASDGAINALLADIYLWRFNYQQCLEVIEEIEATDQYLLMSPGNWFDIFYPGNSLEGIFELQFDKAIGLNNSTYPLTYNNRRFNISEYGLQLLNPDISKEIIRGNGAICIDFNYHNNKNAEFIWKYCGSNPDGRSVRPASENRSANFIIYRYADIRLMKAEALAQNGLYDEALTIINEIRGRASMPLINTILNTPNSFEDVILEERAKEFAYEGKRWFDLLRMGRRNDYARKDDLIEIMIRNVPASQKRILATRLQDPMGWYLPIHEQELERNKALIQNPYYQQYKAE